MIAPYLPLSTTYMADNVSNYTTSSFCRDKENMKSSFVTNPSNWQTWRVCKNGPGDWAWTGVLAEARAAYMVENPT